MIAEFNGVCITKDGDTVGVKQGDRFYKVASHSGHGMYDVTRKENGGWLCTCPDFIVRGPYYPTNEKDPRATNLENMSGRG